MTTALILYFKPDKQGQKQSHLISPMSGRCIITLMLQMTTMKFRNNRSLCLEPSDSKFMIFLQVQRMDLNRYY